jgi:amidase
MLAGDSGPGTWVGQTATQIATAVQRGEGSATAVLADHLDHLAEADRVLEVLRDRRDAETPFEAELVDEQPDLSGLPLAGVPVVIGEDTPIAGQPVWPARRTLATDDHELVRRLRGAGAIVLGTGRMSELGLWAATDDARHPWRGDRSPGGACGGAAAAVSSGAVPLAFGTDGLGSIRVPAACCGLVGFRAEFGAHEHGVLATTVADAALGFDVLAGRRPRPVREPERLRIGVSFGHAVPLLGPDRGTRIALTNAARLLVGLRHDVLRAEPESPPRLARLALGAWAAAAHLDGAGDPTLQPRTRGLAALGGLALRKGLVNLGERFEALDGWFTRHGLDLLLLPAIAGAPPAARAWSGRAWPVNAAATIRLAAYTAPWSLAGFPAVVVPMGCRADGLPAAVQLIGPPGAESRLLAVAGQLERVAPWRRHGPGWPRLQKVARSGHDGAGDPGRRHVRAQNPRRRRADDPARAQPPAVRRSRRAGVAQV